MRHPPRWLDTEREGQAAIARRLAAWALLLGATVALGARATAASDPGLPRAPQMQFVPPPAGSYALERIQPCPDADLLDSTAHRRRLSDVTRDKITLLTFFYTHCTDPLGCPFASGLMANLRDRILADPQLRANVRFVSISFDPSGDSPGELRRYAHGLADKEHFEWDFLTASSMNGLRPLLDDLGQDVRIEKDRDGQPVRAINHMLKLFLIDSRGTVREIYALDFLQPEVMLNDIRTLRMEAPVGSKHEAAAASRR
jgi:cytochrome oxidase Cu insertion factor (SCO1/SenC/PrrC family)